MIVHRRRMRRGESHDRQQTTLDRRRRAATTRTRNGTKSKPVTRCGRSRRHTTATATCITTSSTRTKTFSAIPTRSRSASACAFHSAADPVSLTHDPSGPGDIRVTHPAHQLKSRAALYLLLALGVALTGCSNQMEPAKKALSEIEMAVASAGPDAQRYIPDQVKAVNDQLASLKAKFDQKDYAAVISGAPAVLAKAQALVAAKDGAVKEALAKEAADTAARQAAEAQSLAADWQTLSDALPKQIAALDSRLNVLAKSKKLPANLTKDALTVRAGGCRRREDVVDSCNHRTNQRRCSQRRGRGAAGKRQGRRGDGEPGYDQRLSRWHAAPFSGRWWLRRNVHDRRTSRARAPHRRDETRACTRPVPSRCRSGLRSTSNESTSYR